MVVIGTSKVLVSLTATGGEIDLRGLAGSGARPRGAAYLSAYLDGYIWKLCLKE